MISKKQLKRAMYTFVDGPNMGEIFIVVKFDDTDIHALILYNGGNRNITISRYFMEQLIDKQELEFVETLPKDVFSNIQNTWKNSLDKT